MLTRALRPNIDGLRDAAKQFLIWSLNIKAEFCTSHEDDVFRSSRNRISEKRDYFRPSYEDDEFSSYNRRRSYQRRDYNDFYSNNNERFPRKFSNRRMLLKNEDVGFSANLKPHVKDYYQPHPDVLKRSIEEINQFRKEHDIQIFGTNKEDCPPPILNFSELNLPNNAFNVIKDLKYSTPTPVQSQTWPIALSGKNMVGISQTGSGKTLGFVLPALVHIQHQAPLESGEGPIALMIAPTRELVQQILNVILPFAKSLNVEVTVLFGGSSKKVQVQRLLRGAEICVATPGRLNDILNDDYIKLDRCTYFVLDEADRLLDMGFHPQIKSIFHYCRPDRQVLMWSATWPREVQSLAETFLRNYISVKFGSSELAANPNINQFIHVCEEREKLTLLKDLLEKINETDDNKTIIFAQTKLKADRIGYMLRREGYRNVVIHGDKSQMERDRALGAFRSGEVKILVGTLVVGRGIDIGDIRYVINYDFPNEVEDYVHIIGRTARHNSSGTSHSFFTYEDKNKAQDLIHVLNQAKQPINSELQNMVHSRRIVDGVRVFGGIQRGTRKVFLQAVPDRRATTLSEIIKEKVEPGSVIITDSWPGYQQLQQQGYDHYKVNHSLNVERLWRKVRGRVPHFGRGRLFQDYLEECRFMLAVKEESRLQGFWKQVGKLYPSLPHEFERLQGH